MITRLLAQLILATTLLQLYPADAGVVEERATLPEPEQRVSAGMYEALSLLYRPLPVAADSDRHPTKVDTTSVGVVTSAVSAMVVDRTSGTVLYEKNVEEP